MVFNHNKSVLLIDKLILGFVVLFLISLTNSIFVNQIGYFGALLLIITRYFLTRENKFFKTGLEIPFLLFIIAEILSAIFAVNQPQSFQNLLKRFLLIPIVYTMIASVDDIKKAKLFFKIYITAALITICVYIFFAYEHFISQLYQLEAKGPSPFQYVMTAGGLISFTAIYLFAFFINEKSFNWKKIGLLIIFIIAVIALFSSYTRAAWLGATAGFLMIIILKRKWIIILPLVLFAIIFILYAKSESKFYVFNLSSDSTFTELVLETDGRASSVFIDSSSAFVSDYEEGVLIVNYDRIVNRINTPSPVVSFEKWKDNYYLAVLIHYRFLLVEKQENNQFEIIKELYTPGRTVAYQLKDDLLYTADVDSGVSIFKNPVQPSLIQTRPDLKGFKSITVDTSKLVGYIPDDQLLVIYSLSNGLIGDLLASLKINTNFGNVWLNDEEIYFLTDTTMQVYKLADSDILHLFDLDKLSNTFILQLFDKKLFAVTTDGIIHRAIKNDQNRYEFFDSFNLGFKPSHAFMDKDKLYVTYNKTNRIKSMVDPYHITNINRLNQWKTGFKILASHPIFGVGDIDLHQLYLKYKEPYEKETFGHLHNNYVHFIVILGVFGFIVVVYMLIKIFLLNLKIYKTVKEEEFISSYALGTLAAFTGFLFSGLAEWNFGDHEIITMVWFTIGLNIAFYKLYLLKSK